MSAPMQIEYENDRAFYAGITAIVMQGLGFTADHAALTITLTGGY